MLSRKIVQTIPRAIRTLRRLSVSSLYSGLTFQQFRVLNQASEGMGQRQMSQNMQVSTAAVSKTVDTLVKKKLLVREEGTDRRCFNLTLTAEGMQLKKLITGQVEKSLNKSFKRLTEKEKSDLIKGLEVLDKLMEYVNEDQP